jgi:hypothetical protein
MAHKPKRESIKCNGKNLPKKQQLGIAIISLIASLTSSEKPAYYRQAYRLYCLSKKDATITSYLKGGKKKPVL